MGIYKMKSNIESKKVAAVGLAAVVIAGGIGAALGAYVADDSKQVADMQAQIEALVAAEPVIVTEYETVIETIEVPVNVTVEKEVLVDNGNLDLLLQYAYDNKGNLSLLTDSLKESELDLVVERLLFMNDVEALTLESARHELVELVHNRNVSGVVIVRRDISRVRFDEDSVSVNVLSFRYSDAVGSVNVEFEADGIKYKAVVDVEIKNGSVEEVSLASISVQ